jgi:LuxR family maltose regulon positive regulatory protein
MIKVVALSLSWQLSAAWKLLGQVETLLEESNESAQRWGALRELPVLRGIIATLRGQEAYGHDQADRAIAYSEDALALLPQRWGYVRGIAVMYWGLGMQASGRGDTALNMLIDEYTGLSDKSDAYALRLLFVICFNAVEAGHLEQAMQTAHVMLDHSMSSQMQQSVGFSHYFLGVVHYYWNELDAARQHFEELVVNRFSVHTQAARNGMIGLIRVHMANAEISAAWSVMELLSQFDLDRLGQDGDDARSLRAQLEYAQGDSESALHWADSYAVPVQGRSLLWLQNPHLAKARILLARGTGADAQSALDILDVIGEFAQHTFNIRVQIKVLALRALALEIQGKAVAAVATLQQALELAQPGGIIRIFIDLGADMRAMLLRLAKQGFAAETVRRILAAFPEPQRTIASGNAESTSRAVNARLVEPLTDRELDVLTLLRERLSNKEIAQTLVLSPATVKRYTINVYEKLGVSKRWDAVVKAETLGILPPR